MIKKECSFLLLLLLITSAAIPIMNTASAQTKFFPYIYAAPNPIGLGQSANVGFGFTLPTVDPYYYQGWKLVVTDPSGNNQTLGPFSSDATGGTGTSFTPDEIGTWKFQAFYPGGNVTYIAKQPFPQTTYYVPPSQTEQVSLTVNSEPLSSSPLNPIPNSYWEYPIYSDNINWYQISSNWLMPGYDTFRIRIGAISGVYAPDTPAPMSGHILWTDPWLFGGVAAYTSSVSEGLTKSNLGPQTYYSGSNYREEMTPPVIINGKIYYNQVDPPAYGFYCVNLYTGEKIWFQNQTYLSGTTQVGGTAAQISLGQILIQNDENQNGAVPYLWATSSTTWARFDAFSGNLLNTIVNASSLSMSGNNAAAFFGPSGELLVYMISQTSAQLKTNTASLVKWNSTLCGLTGSYNQAQRLNIPWKNGIQWNVTVTAAPNIANNNGQITWDPKDPTMLIVTNQTNGNPLVAGVFTDLAYSTDTGQLLWRKDRNLGGDTWEGLLFASRAMGEGIYTIYKKETRQLFAYDSATGNEKWVSEPRPNALGVFVGGEVIAHGLVMQSAYDGYIYAYDVNTGKTVWSFYDGAVNPSGLEVPYGQYPFYGALVVANGVLFAGNQEHTEQSPLFRGEALYAINATTGKLIWQIKGQYKQQSLAGGVLIAPNQCDGQNYAFGRGPTRLTVNAPSVGITTATPITISGTISDISAGSRQTVVAANFPNGLPCVSEDSMSAWMEYVYMQQSRPINATGVQVIFNVIDSNGNYRNIGTTTSDASGTYGFTWTPDIAGDYTVTANFAGSASYYPSSAQTYFHASDVSTQTPTNQPVTNNSAESYIFMMGAAIIAVIVIMSLLIILMLRRRQ